MRSYRICTKCPCREIPLYSKPTCNLFFEVVLNKNIQRYISYNCTLEKIQCENKEYIPEIGTQDIDVEKANQMLNKLEQISRDNK